MVVACVNCKKPVSITTENAVRCEDCKEWYMTWNRPAHPVKDTEIDWKSATTLLVLAFAWIGLLVAIKSCVDNNMENLPQKIVTPWYERHACAWLGAHHVEVLSVGKDTYLVADTRKSWRRNTYGVVIGHREFEEHAVPTTCPERRLPPWARK